ncbi:MAG: fasciclin domain-containing protein [Odoribacteraceae bacterium]|jgi:hypothetical protein|nr:fasciclin domain-containing protein [Odoribacteraceae bacterium]
MGKKERTVVLTLWALSLLLLAGCEEKWEETVPRQENVQKGFSYDILKERGSFEIFLDAAERTGFTDLLTGKGLSTLFVPTDVAFKRYFRRRGISGLEEIPGEELRLLVGQHCLRYSYNKEQLLNFQPDVESQIAIPGINYKFRTAVHERPEQRFDPKQNKMITVANLDKYLPVFGINTFKAVGAKNPEENYRYFFPKSNWYGVEDEHLYAANAGVLESSIPTDNGYLYIVDNVIEPLRTIYKVMEGDTNKYGLMLKLYDRFPGFLTKDESFANRYMDGLPYATTYMFLHMDTQNFMLLPIGNEWTTERDDWLLLSKVTYNAFVPSNATLNSFFREFWGDPNLSQRYKDYNEVDPLAIYYFISNHFVKSDGLIFPEQLRAGMVSEWGYPYGFNVDTDVDYKEICGNGTFYGLTKVDVPTIFETAPRPTFQSPKYRIFSYMLAKSGMLSLLANKERELTLFLLSDETLTELGYNLNNSGSTLNDYTVRKGSSTVSATDMETIVRGQVINRVINMDEITTSEQEWMETDNEDAFVQIGSGRMLSEDGAPVNLGVDEFNSSGRWGTWRAYEVKGLLSSGIDILTELIEDQTKPYRAWLKTNFKEKIIKSTDHDIANVYTDPLKPFTYGRGLIFCTLDTWGNPGSLGIPPVNANDKVPLTDWLSKHMVSRQSDTTFVFLDVLKGTIADKELQTVHKDFKIKVLSMDPVFNNTYGNYRMRIQLPFSENDRVVEAYGPHFAKECMFFILTKAEDRFVWGDD